MNVPVLVIYVGAVQAGMLFKYAPENAPPIQRFVVNEAYASEPFGDVPVLSESMRAASPEQQRSFWLDITAQRFNSEQDSKGQWLLPPWFQNLLPEGIFRRHVAEEAKINVNDFFALLAACGKDLPGKVRAVWQELDRQTLARLVTQNNDALEMTVAAEPFQAAISISGVQPKLGVNRTADGRFVGRTHLGDTSIIAKLPAPDYPRMPEVETVSMTLARAAGIKTCDFSLEPMQLLQAPHRYDLGEEAQGNFFAVHRFDRSPAGRIHMEDFAQVLGVAPDLKYTKSYLAIATTLIALPGCGEPAVLELIKRIAFNDLIGNADMHLKNIALLYSDGVTATLSPAYDVVAQALYHSVSGHALHLFDESVPAHDPKEPIWKPGRLREFCSLLGMSEKPAEAQIRQVVLKTLEEAPTIVTKSGMTPKQKHDLLRRIHRHGHAQSSLRRHKELGEHWVEVLKQTDF
jgi:serine/threonine-protein kinase HipA